MHSLVKGVPVWWSLSDRAPMLVGMGWRPGGDGRSRKLSPPPRGGRSAVRSLAEILAGRAIGVEKGRTPAWLGHDWSKDPFSRGAYSFTAAGADDGAKKLREPLQDTVFFAGEATAEGAEVGTVHGALKQRDSCGEGGDK